MFKINKKTQNDVITYFCFKFEHIFKPFSSISVVDFEQAILARFAGVQKQSLEDVDVFKDVDVS